jgi:WD40 repeat protein
VLLLVLAVGASVGMVVLSKQLRRAEEAERDGQGKLWEAYLDRAQARRVSRRPGQRFDALRAIQEALKLPVPPGRSLDELRNEAIAALVLPDLAVEKEWDGWPVGSGGQAFDAAFERYARGDKDGNVSIRRVADDQELLTLPGAGPVSDYGGLAFSPDGRFLHQSCETAGGGRSRLWRLDGTKPVAVLDAYRYGFTFRPDGRECAASYPDGSIRVHELPTGKERRRWQLAFPDPSPGLLWNPKRPLLLAFSPKAAWVLHAETGRVVWRLSEGGVVSWVDWHPEGRLLAVSSVSDRKIRLWDVDTRQLVLTPLEGHKIEGIVVRFDPSGERLVSTDWSHLWRLWDVQTGRQLLAVPAGGHVPQFNAGTLAGAAANFPRLWTFRYRPGQEFRTLIPRRGPRMEAAGLRKGPAALDPTGRVLAVTVQDGVALLDIARGEEIALVPVTGNGPLAFEPSGALLTQGSSGLLRWRVAVDAGTGQPRYGPPERLYRPTGVNLHGASADRRVLAIPSYSSGAIVLHRDGNRTVRLGPQQDVRSCAVSPGGRWVATGSHSLREGAGAKVWDARTGAHVADLPVGGHCAVDFSPDGKWLATTGGGLRLWEVGSWRPGPVVTTTDYPADAFATDGQLLAVTDEPGVVRLIFPQTGKELARLAAPVDGRLWPRCFTPDGTRLIALGEDGAVHVFDLAAIRRQLRDMGLDWGAPALPDPPTTPRPRLHVEVDPGALALFHGPPGETHQQRVERCTAILRANPDDVAAWWQRGEARARLGQEEPAVADLEKSLALRDDQANVLDLLARLRLRGGERLRDPKKALGLANRAVGLDAADTGYRGTLGLALYHNGRFAEAVAPLERCIQGQPGLRAALHLLYLAMCQQRLGDKARARDCFDQAVRWRDAQKALPADQAKLFSSYQADAVKVLDHAPK